MRIVQVIPSFEIAGAEIMCENLIYGLRQLGQEICVISLYNIKTPITKRIEASGLRIIYLDKKPGLDFSIILKLRKIFLEFNPDVIHTHLYVDKYVFLASYSSVKKKIVHTIHSIASEECGEFDKIINGFLFKKRLSIPVALSKTIKNSIINCYKLKNIDVPIVFNGLQLEKYHKKNDYKVNGNFKIIHIGRFSKPKNHKCLIEGFAKFNKKYSNSELILLGEGKLEDKIMHYIKEYSLQDKVHLLGIKENVSNYLYDSDLFILPSLYEGMPMSLIEAMATGLPIVASNVGGIPDMLDDKKDAFLINPSSNEIAKSIEFLFLNDNLRTRLGINSYKKSYKFSNITMAKKYMEIYEKV